MTRLPRTMLVIGAVLGIAFAPSCATEHCTGSGLPLTCSKWDEAKCRKQPGCFWNTGCVLAVTCPGKTRAECNALSFCYWNNGGFCALEGDPCLDHATSECTADPNCMVAPACVGKPVACESHEDETSCRQDLNCGWDSEPAF
jgi:hypothetical protein